MSFFLPQSTPAIYNTPSESGRTPTSVFSRRSEVNWTDWQERNNCRLNDGVRNIQEVDTLIKGLKYPRIVKDEKVVESLSYLEKVKNNRMKLNSESIMTYEFWANALNEGKIEVDDPFEFETSHCALFFFWDSHSNAKTRFASKYGRRKGVDGMIELAFELRSGAMHIYRLDERMVLPDFPWTTKADAIATMSLPFDWLDSLQALGNRHVFSFSNNIHAGFSVVTFIFETTSEEMDDGSCARQLTLEFSSAQHQRRALGFEDRPIFGATLVGSTLATYVSVWRHNRIVVNRTHYVFYLNIFPGFVQCYFFLCKLAEYASQEVEKECARWKTESSRKELQQRNREASTNPWRLPVYSRTESNYPNKRPHNAQDGIQDSWRVVGPNYNENDPEIVAILSSVKNGDPAPEGGYPLDVKHVFAHKVHCGRHADAVNTSIENWAKSVALFTSLSTPATSI